MPLVAFSAFAVKSSRVDELHSCNRNRCLAVGILLVGMFSDRVKKQKINKYGKLLSVYLQFVLLFPPPPSNGVSALDNLSLCGQLMAYMIMSLG